ncbi:MAG: recombinase family protein [Candidatus Nanopelagicales bacterium]
MKTTRAAIYARISLTKTDDDTAGVDRQLAACRDLADAKGWTAVGEYVDNNRSAMTGKRPQYARLLDDVESGGIDVVVVWSADRLYRRLADLEELVDRLGRTKVATVMSGDVDLSTADGRMTARILGSVAQRESEKFAERMKASCRQRAEQGRLAGGPRWFGYTADHRDLVPAEADAIRDAAAQVVQGVPLRRIAADWRDRGLTGPTGSAVTAATVRAALLRPDVAGLSAYRGKEARAKGEPARIVGTLVDRPAILTAEQHHQLVAILTSPARTTPRGRPGSTLLGETLTCAACGAPLAAQSRRQRTGPRVPTYNCRAGHVTRDREPMDAAVSALVVEYLRRNADRLRRPVQAAGKVSKAAEKADRLRAKLAAMPALLVGDDAMDPMDYAAAVGTLRAELRALESSLARTSTTPSSAALVGADDVAAAWEAVSVETQRRIVRELVESIVVDRRPRGGAVTDAVTVRFKDFRAEAAA